MASELLTKIKQRSLVLRKKKMQNKNDLDTAYRSNLLVLLVGRFTNSGTDTKEFSDFDITKLFNEFKASNDVIIKSSKDPAVVEKAKVENDEIDYLMPPQLTDEELDVIIKEQIVANDYTMVSDIGKVNQYLKEQYAGRYDPKNAGGKVKQLILGK